MESKDLVEAAKAALQRVWAEVTIQGSGGALADVIDDESLRDAIQRAINSATKTYRYVLPTQVVAKVSDATCDCRSIQVASGKPGAFDARSLCTAVIVPFDRANSDVLGASTDPYVNQPLRQPEVTFQFLGKQKNSAGWRDLCKVLEAVEVQSSPTFTETIFRQVLIEIYRRLSDVQVLYPVPLRASLEQCITITGQYLAAGSGGDRAQAIASALFLVIGETFHLYTDVRRSHTNAADLASGQVADLDCVTEGGNIVMSVEVKDKELVLREVEDKLPNMRAQRVTELLILALRGVARADEASITHLVTKEFASGQNIHILRDFSGFLRVVLALFGEAGRRRYLETVGQELDRYRSEIQHRRAWAALLRQL